MDCVFRRSKVYINGKFVDADLLIRDGIVASIAEPNTISVSEEVNLFDNCHIFPGFIDVHVHLREPGFSYKETIESGTLAAAHGGYTKVCAMPNLNPVPDSMDTLNIQLELIKSGAKIPVVPYGAITKGENGTELADMEKMAPYTAAFSDDGRGVQNPDMMKLAMKKAKELDKIIAAHCEDNSLLNGGYIHDGEYAAAHGHRGICSKSEWGQIERDIALAEETGCKYHVCHISTKESVELIRQAKKRGVDITCETGPHYLVLDDSMLKESGNFKMNPPLRSKADKQALIEGILDGTIDMIATDHAPHSAEEKSRGLEGSAMGIVGLETAFPVLYTNLVLTGVITLEKLIELMTASPAKRFGFESGIKEGMKADLTAFDLNEKYAIDPDTFKSKGKSTPFIGMEVYGKCLVTYACGKIAWL